MQRVYNFAAGPGVLPVPVLQEVAENLVNYKGQGMSVLEMSHRGATISAICDETKSSIRTLLQVPEEFDILFLQGGGHMQFAMVALNLLGQKGKAAYIVDGVWSKKAAAEAARFGEVSVIGQTTPFSVPDEGTLTVPEDISYLYYCQNETVHGLEFNYVPKTPALSALVSDISSNFMTRYVDFTKHDLVFAGAQKNFGPAGLTVVIIRKSLLGKALSTCPTMLDYAVHAKAESMYNTPPVFPIYVASLVCRWIASEGGIAEMNRRSIERSSLVYGAIDASDGFYINRYRACERSRMNVVFTIKDPSLNEAFLRQAAERDLTNLKGHRILGGFRASLYNAMPVAGARALAEFMRDFAREHG
ncbi:MAG: phosphoserine transaminase [Sutterella sp.]|nr:phosphoserine transaminase [Sutterella sp.]